MKKSTREERPASRSTSRGAGAKKKQNKAIYYVVLAILLAILVFSVGKIVSYFKQQADAQNIQSGVQDEFVTPGDDQPQVTDPVVPDNEQKDDEEEKEPEKDPEPVKPPEPETISVDFAGLTAKYPDVVGYIYAANTGISYPIVQSSSNDYYLDHDLDGNENNNGSIFMEHLCSPDFSDHNTIIYGHNMKTGLMFAHLTNYKNQSYYNVHPYFYIYTPTQDYKLNLFAGFVCEHDDEVYDLSLTQSQLESMIARSTFKANIGVPTGNVVTLSTCSYEFDDARYVVLGELVPINDTAG